MGNIDPNLAQLLSAIATTIGAIFIWLNSRKAEAARLAAEQALSQSAANHALVQATRADVRTIEVATNSMKDALVKVTEEAGILTGRAQVTAERDAADASPSKAKPSVSG